MPAATSFHVDLLTRLCVAALLGAIIGYERDRHGRQVGLRTHLLVAIAAATFMIVSSKFVYFQHYSKDDLVSVDPSRIAASVVTGIGFLAGGSIIRNGLSLQGLTTGAGLWLVTAIGLSAGAGMYVESVAATVLGMLVLTLLRRLEDKDDRTTRRRISIVLGEDQGSAATVVGAIKALGAVVTDMGYERRLDDKRRLAVTLDVRLPNSVALETLIEELEKQPGVRRVQVQTPA